MAERIHSPLPPHAVRERLLGFQHEWRDSERPTYLAPLNLLQPRITLTEERFAIRLEPVPHGRIRYRAFGSLSAVGEGTLIELRIRPTWSSLVWHFAQIIGFAVLTAWIGAWFNAILFGIVTVGGTLAVFTMSRDYANAFRMVVRDAAGLDPRSSYLESVYR